MTTIGRYELIRRLARGGMAELFLARATGLEGFAKVVVLKRILPHLVGDPEFVEMFLDEARLAAQLDHPNVVHVHDIGREDDEFFFTMEYLHGEDLRSLLRAALRAQTMIPLEHALTIIVGVATGLHHAHDRIGLEGKPLGLVHRDVSPTNILVTYDGGVKLVDFGIAKAASSRHATRPSTRKGKTAYMSPEQCRGRSLDRRSDIFALGIVLWELTTGRRLFRAEDEFAVMNQIVNHDADPPSTFVEDYPPELDAIVCKALARDPDQRYATARELQRDLEAFAHEQRLRLSNTELGEYVTELMGHKPFPWETGGDGVDESDSVDARTSDPDATRKQLPPALANATAAHGRASRTRMPWLVAGVVGVVGVSAAGMLVARTDDRVEAASPSKEPAPEGEAAHDSADVEVEDSTHAPTPRPPPPVEAPHDSPVDSATPAVEPPTPAAELPEPPAEQAPPGSKPTPTPTPKPKPKPKPKRSKAQPADTEETPPPRERNAFVKM